MPEYEPDSNESEIDDSLKDSEARSRLYFEVKSLI